jgi:hypothetical protein
MHLPVDGSFEDAAAFKAATELKLKTSACLALLRGELLLGRCLRRRRGGSLDGGANGSPCSLRSSEPTLLDLAHERDQEQQRHEHTAKKK